MEFKLIENTMTTDDKTIAGSMVLTNGSGDSKVTFIGSDKMVETSIDELYDFLMFIQAMPKEITQFSSSTYIVKMEGPEAKAMLIELTKLSIDSYINSANAQEVVLNSLSNLCDHTSGEDMKDIVAKLGAKYFNE